MQPSGQCSASVIWRGTNPSEKGVGVVSAEATRRLEFVEIPSLHPTVVPVRVQAPQPFVFVGVWTHPDPDYNTVAWEAMKACVAAADGLPVVAAGDFNSSSGVQGQERDSPWFLQHLRDELGLVSAYHHLSGESHGEETRASHYWLWKEANPFHIDYCFVAEAWVDRLTGVRRRRELLSCVPAAIAGLIIVRLALPVWTDVEFPHEYPSMVSPSQQRGMAFTGQNGNSGWRVHMATYTPFPYESFAAGQKDSWSKAGGPSEVFRFVKKGYMLDQFLKLARMKRQADIEEGLRRLRESRGENGDLDDQRLRSVGLIK